MQANTDAVGHFQLAAGCVAVSCAGLVLFSQYVDKQNSSTQLVVERFNLCSRDGENAICDVPEEADALIRRFKSDNARRLITAIAAQGRALVKAELYLAEMMEQ